MSYTRPPLLHAASGEVIDGGFPFHVNANGNQLLVTGPCYFDSVAVGKTGSADWAITVYDGIDATGMIIGVFDFNSGGSYPFSCVMEKGVFISAAGTTPGDVTFIIADPSKI